MKDFLLLITLFLPLETIGQNIVPATRQEVKVRNGITYFQGKPHNGVVYERGGPNNNIIVFEAEYVNGRPHGPYTEKHTNGVTKFSATYDNGKLDDGTHYVYDRSGKKVKGKVYANGRLSKIETYKGGKLNGITREYDANQNVRKTTTYESGKKSGVEKEMDRSGRVIAEREYSSGVIQSYEKIGYHNNGNLKYRAECNNTGIEHGIKEVYFDSGALQKKSEYNNGIETKVLVENADPSRTVGKLLGDGHQIYMCDRMRGLDTVYVMVTFDFQGAGVSGEIRNNIIKRLNGRMKEINAGDITGHRNKAVRYAANFKNPRIGSAYQKAKIVYGLKVPPGYRGTASVDCQVKDLRTNTQVANRTLSGQTVKYDNRNTAKNNAAVAVMGAVDRLAYGFFKLSGELTSILKSNRRGIPKRVEVNLGSGHNLGNGFAFNVYDQLGTDRSKIGYLILQDVLGENSSRCKVKEGKNAIKKLMDRGKPIYVEGNFKF